MLDPACGDGACLRGARRWNPDAVLVGIEVDPRAAAQARRTTPGAEVLVADALAPGLADAIVGNPPYVRARRLDPEVRADLRARFSFAEGQFDLTVPFIERSLSWLRPGGRLGFVLPNKVLVSAYARRLREALTGQGDEGALVEVTDLAADETAFAGVCAYPVLVVVERRRAGPASRIVVAEGRLEGEVLRTVDRRDMRLADWRPGAPVRPDVAAERVWARSDLRRFGEIATAREAVHTGNVRTKLVRQPPSERGAPLLRGRDVRRWRTDWTGLRLREDLTPDRSVGEYARVPPPEFFEPPKVLLREIASRPTAAYDDRGLRCLNKAYVVRTRATPDPCRLQALAAVLNSEPFARLFRARYSAGSLRGGHLQFKPQWLRETPVPDLDAAVAAGLHTLAARSAAGEDLDAAVDAAVADLYGWPEGPTTGG